MADSGERGPQTHLEELLVAAADDPEGAVATDAFLAGFIESTIGLLVEGSEQEGDDTLAMVVVEGEAGPHAFAFTHGARVERFGALARLESGGVDLPLEHCQVVGYPVRELLPQFVRANVGLLVNAESAYGKLFTPSEMSDLVSGIPANTRTRMVAERTPILVGVPAVIPAGMIDRLRAHCARVPGVSRAALAWVRYPDGLEGYLLEAVGPSRDAFTADLGKAIGDAGGRTCDVVVSAEATYTTDMEPFFVAGEIIEES